MESVREDQYNPVRDSLGFSALGDDGKPYGWAAPTPEEVRSVVGDDSAVILVAIRPVQIVGGA